MTCPSCGAAATSWTYGGYVDGCRGCMVRQFARMPAHFRREAYTAFHAKHQDMAAVRALQAEVKAEHERIATLRKQQEGSAR